MEAFVVAVTFEVDLLCCESQRLFKVSVCGRCVRPSRARRTARGVRLLPARCLSMEVCRSCFCSVLFSVLRVVRFPVTQEIRVSSMDVSMAASCFSWDAIRVTLQGFSTESRAQAPAYIFLVWDFYIV